MYGPLDFRLISVVGATLRDNVCEERAGGGRDGARQGVNGCNASVLPPSGIPTVLDTEIGQAAIFFVKG